MTLDVTVAEFGLLLAGWVVSFLLGRELQTGFVAVRNRGHRAPRS
jgi:hypothetical protein